MDRDRTSDLGRSEVLPPKVAIPTAILVLLVLAATFVLSLAAGAPKDLPGVALESPLILHAIRAFAVAALMGGTAIAILRLWRGELPTKLSTTAIEWPTVPDAAPARDVQEQLLRVERESKAAIDQLAALVRPLLGGPEDSIPVDAALERWEAALSDAEKKDALADAIAALPEREKLVIALTYYENLTAEEIAEMLGVSRQTVYQLRSRALRKVRQQLGRDPFEHEE